MPTNGNCGAITQSLEDYLEAVYVLAGDQGGAQVRDVARRLSVKMPSVVKAIHELKKLELAQQEPYGPIRLTAEGRKIARRVARQHELLREFLQKLGVTRETADRDACLMEHILSEETLDRIRIYTGKKR